MEISGRHTDANGRRQNDSHLCTHFEKKCINVQYGRKMDQVKKDELICRGHEHYWTEPEFFGQAIVGRPA